MSKQKQSVAVNYVSAPSIENKAVTLRAGIIGLVLSIIIAIWGQFAADHVGYNYVTYAHLPAALLIPFFFLVYGPHLLVKY